MTPEELDALTAVDDLTELFVGPRHLAGGGPAPDLAIRPLLDTGFSLHHTDDGNTHLDSPCRRVRVAWTPEGDDIGAWHVTAATLPMHLPQWKFVADMDIPFEAVAAFTTALALELKAERDDFLWPPQGAAPGWYPLVEAGWRDDIRRNEATFTAPDGLAQLVTDRGPLSYAGEMSGGTKAWEFQVGAGRIRDYATFTTGTPKHLIGAFAQALVDPSPVARTRHCLSKSNLPHLTATHAITTGPETDPRRQAARSHTTGRTGPAPTSTTVTTTTTAVVVAGQPGRPRPR